MKVLYFASYREILGLSEEEIELPSNIKTVSGLLDILHSRDGVWLDTLNKNESVLIAVNQEMAQWDTLINKGDEVAFFPPVTGG